MRTIGKLLLRGLVVILPTFITLYVLWWIGSGTERLLMDLIPVEHYWPGMGILLGLLVVLAVGCLAGVWLFSRLGRLLEQLLEHIPLVKTLYGSMKDLMQFFPGDKKKPSMKKVVLAEIGGMKIVGMVTRETFDELPEAMRREGEVLVYCPMSYQLGGFTLWMPRSALT
ncbi:MAG TPA: DUF502 domain-containing protein, partial [Planctomycetota bacterium]|nr:DUF502 domain-containing protein [Planctomycetota bacterium]